MAMVCFSIRFDFNLDSVLRLCYLRRSFVDLNWKITVVDLSLVCSFSRMKGHLHLAQDVKPDAIPEDTVKAVAETLKSSSTIKVSEDG